MPRGSVVIRTHHDDYAVTTTALRHLDPAPQEARLSTDCSRVVRHKNPAAAAEATECRRHKTCDVYDLSTNIYRPTDKPNKMYTSRCYRSRSRVQRTRVNGQVIETTRYESEVGRPRAGMQARSPIFRTSSPSRSSDDVRLRDIPEQYRRRRCSCWMRQRKVHQIPELCASSRGAMPILRTVVGVLDSTATIYPQIDERRRRKEKNRDDKPKSQSR